MPGALLKLLAKDKLLYSGKVTRRMAAETPEERHAPLVQKDFLASISAQSLMNVYNVTATSTF